MSRKGWLLTAEPIADDVAYSLFSDSGTGPQLIDAGIISDLGREKDLATTLLPSAAAPFSGPLTDPNGESAAAAQLGRRLLPLRLIQGLVGVDPDQTTVTIATRGWLATVPWPVLTLIDDGSVRLVERAMVLGGLSPALTANRALVAADHAPTDPGLIVADPGPETGQPAPLYPADLPPELHAELSASDQTTTGSLDRDQLTSSLLTRPSRFLYLGHLIPAPATAPAQAALVLTTSAGRADYLTARDWLAEPHRWPMPERVALIGCAGNDTTSREQSGLVVAAINAGARLITTTRWLLPTDVTHHPVRATSRLVGAVYQSHRSPDAARSLHTWQRHEMRQWRDTTSVTHAPLLWASLVTYLS